jgi:hypothetical protein
VDETESMKALKAGKTLNIAGGEFTINACDDGVHSNGDVTVSSGKLSIETGDDGIHADGVVSISGGVVDISVCYEGIEGTSVSVSGGSVTVVASDDAVNAAGGADDAASGPMGRDRFSLNSDVFVRISGGSLDLYGGRDGIDANGDIFLEGGVVKISGLSMGMDGAIDLDGAFRVTGGELITAGSVANVSQNSTQAALFVSYGASQPVGSVITIKDASGKTVLEYKSKTAFTLSGFTSKEFKVGKTYTLYIDGKKKTDVTLTGNVTGIADDGGAYNGARGPGGGRGMQRERDNQRGRDWGMSPGAPSL